MPARGTRWIPLAVALLLAGGVGYGAVQSWRADRWMSSSHARGWEKAVQLEPGNADYWDRLGRFRQFDFENSDLPLAIEYFRRATLLDPMQADYWLDLATAYETQGSSEQARETFLRAKQMYPLSSEVAWRYGNFLLRQGQLPESLAEIRRAVAGDPKLAPLAASRAWHATGDIARVLADVLPATKESYLSSLDAFVDEGALDQALAVWNRLVQLGQPIELPRANRLVEKLAVANRADEARAVWQQALLASGAVPRGTQNFPLVTDGGFERDPTNGGFDWRIYPATGVELDFDSTVAHTGSRSLRLTFDGSSNIAFTQVVQFVPIQPRTRYHLAAYFRVEALTTDSGIRLMVYHPSGPGTPDIFSPNLVGTQPWALAAVDFTTGPDARVIEIHLCRLPSNRLDNKVRGTAWVDDVTLVPIGADAPGAIP